MLDVYAYAGSVGPAAALGDRRYTCHPTFNHYLVSKIPRAEIRAFIEFLIAFIEFLIAFIEFLIAFIEFLIDSLSPSWFSPTSPDHHLRRLRDRTQSL